MPRCYICNYCPEIDGGSDNVRWRSPVSGFVCSSCTAIGVESLVEFGFPEDDSKDEVEERAEHETNVEGFTILEDT